MGDNPGMIKPDLRALPTIKERMTFLYVERCLFLHLSLYGFFESFAGLYEPRTKAVKRFLEIFCVNKHNLVTTAY